MTSYLKFRYWKRAKADPPATQEFLATGLQRLGKISQQAVRKTHQSLEEHY
ncbi:MAG: hypothetical protein ACR2NK_07510 [Mariniblastus sp.]